MANVKQRKLTDSTIVEVFNNTSGVVGFRSESNRKKYRWDKPDSRRKVTLGELKDLVYSSGGFELLKECLLIKDIDVRIELGLPIEKEHILDDNDIVQLLKNGTAEDLENVLSKTNSGIREKTSAIAIELEISDLNKLEIIERYTGVDVLAQIKEKREEKNKKEKADK